MSKQHTPTPWTFKKMPTLNNPYWIVGNNKEDVVAFRSTYQASTDAQFIIKAVNNHDRLVEALEKTNESLRLLSVLAIDDSFSSYDADKAYRQYEETKQLLIELKQQ